MYTIALLTALTSGTTAPDAWLHRHSSSCQGCSTCTICYGCNACTGCSTAYGCNACTGCSISYGSVHGTHPGAWGAAGCVSPLGNYGYNGCSCTTCYACHGCYGCYGCYGCSGYAPFYRPGLAPTVPTPSMPPAKEEKKEEKEKLPTPRTDKSSLPNTGRLVVELPENARLFIDDQPMKVTASTTRTFTTPALQEGETYYYIVRVEVERAGKIHSDSKRVLIRSGEEGHASFKTLGITSTAKAP